MMVECKIIISYLTFLTTYVASPTHHVSPKHHFHTENSDCLHACQRLNVDLILLYSLQYKNLYRLYTCVLLHNHVQIFLGNHIKILKKLLTPLPGLIDAADIPVSSHVASPHLVHSVSSRL